MKPSNASGSALAPFFQKVEQLSKPQRIGIYAGTMVVILILVSWLRFWPQYKQIGKLEKQLVTVQAQLAKAKKNAAELNDWRNKMRQKEAEYKTVMRALPEKEEIPTLLASISQAGKDAGLDFLLWQPKAEQAREFYAEIPVEMNLVGSYHQVAVFCDKVANLSRIVNIRDLKLTPASSKEGGSGLLTASCQAVTYKFIESAPKAKKGSSQAQRRK